MRSYQKAAIFIIVLLLSVSLISEAIDILGDISNVDLDKEQDQKIVESIDVATEKKEGQLVEAFPQEGTYPLYEIHLPPQTKYLRQGVGEIYENGAWKASESHEPVTYQGEFIELKTSGYESLEQSSFTITPLFNISGFIPATLSVFQLKFEGTLQRYPSMEAYSSDTPSSQTYWVSHVNYDFSDATLKAAELDPVDYCLDLSDELSERLKNLASEIVGDLSTPWEKLVALEQYLEENHVYDEDYTPPSENLDPIERFLFHERRGICTHFSSAFVLLSRSLGLPARVVYGYLVDPDIEFQFVLPKQAHMYAEVPFKELGWITFEATPERSQEKPVSITRIPTLTNITGNDPVGIKGASFNVWGKVTTSNGSAVDDLSVEVFLMVSKNETGVLCGQDEVREGFFKITCEVAPELEVGDYMLVAHTLGNAVYEESWSDPPIQIIAETEVIPDVPISAYIGEPVQLRGKLIDKSNSQPIVNRTLIMAVGNETFNLVTDSTGSVSMDYVFEMEGNMTVNLNLTDSEYYLDSGGVVGIAVTSPPPYQPGLVEVLTMFPYNAILVGFFAVSTTTVVLLWNKRRQKIIGSIEEESIMDVFDDVLSFESYKEGIVQLFNRFYTFTRRKFEEVLDCLTPREFQRVLLKKIPGRGNHALEDLVSAFEIANYSEAYPSKLEYDKSYAAAEMLKELIQDG